MPSEDDYLVYTYNRFQACRFGLDAVYVDPSSGQHQPLREHLLATLDQLERHASAQGAEESLRLIRRSAEMGHNDARWLREQFESDQQLAETTRQAGQKFRV